MDQIAVGCVHFNGVEADFRCASCRGTEVGDNPPKTRFVERMRDGVIGVERLIGR